MAGVRGLRRARPVAGAVSAGVILTLSTFLLPAAGPAAADTGGGAAAGASFTYQGLRYEATGLIARPYPGPDPNAGTYWIVRYEVTDITDAPIAVPADQGLLLFGPGGAQLAPAAALGGAAPVSLNPDIPFSSDEVFNVPAGANPAQYRLGFIPYQVVGGQYFASTPQRMALPDDSGSTQTIHLNTTYELQNMFTNNHQATSEQNLTLNSLVETDAVAPELSAASFNPTTAFWIVHFTFTNNSSVDLSLAAADFVLDQGGEDTIAPLDIPQLPGYIPATGLWTQGGVNVPGGATFTGSLLFPLPAGTPTADPQLQFFANGQTRIVSLAPCQSGACPPVLG